MSWTVSPDIDMHCLSSSSQQPCEIETLVVPILQIRTSRHSEAKQLIYFSVVGWHSNPGQSACLPPSIDLTRLSDRTRISHSPNCSCEVGKSALGNLRSEGSGEAR